MHATEIFEITGYRPPKEDGGVVFRAEVLSRGKAAEMFNIFDDVLPSEWELDLKRVDVRREVDPLAARANYKGRRLPALRDLPVRAS